MSTTGVLEILRKNGFQSIPRSVFKYFFCSPNLDFIFRCMPSAGGLYSQRYRDYIEFNIIENRIRDVQSREKK